MSTLVANGAAMVAARLIGPVLSFAINVAIARACGPGVLGAFAFLMALAAIFQTGAAAGLTGLLTREMAAHPENARELLRRGRTLASLAGVVSTVAFVAVAALLSRGGALTAAAILATSVLPSAWIAVHEARFMATRAHHQVTLVALGENALRFALAMTAIVAGGGVVALAASVAVSRFAGMIASAVLVERSGVRDAWRPVPVGQLRDFAAAVAPFGLLLFAGMAYFRLDVLMSEALLGAVPTGVYAAALTFYTAAMIVPDGLMAAVYPRLAARFRESPDGYAQATRMTVRMVTAALVPVSLGLVCLAPLLLKVAYGGRYAGAVPVLRLLAASLPIHAANAALGQALLAGNLQGPMLRGTLVSLVLHAVTLGLFLPRVGIVAAPVSMAFSSALFTAWCAWVFHRRVSRLSWDPSLARNMAAIVVPIALTLAAPEGWTLAGAVVGLAFLAAVGGRTLLAGVEFAPAAAPRLGKDPA